MKIFAVKDASEICKTDMMWLIYSPVGKTFFMELPDETDPLNIPMPLDSFYRKGIRTIGSEASLEWVRLRVVPPDRQNIAAILSELNIPAYDESKLLEYTKGRCANDDYFIQKITEEKLPKYLRERLSRRVRDFMPAGKEHLTVFFLNGETKICDLHSIKEKLSSHARPEYASVMYEGYGVSWGCGDTEILYDELYSSGVNVPVSYEDVLYFVRNRIVDTAAAANELGCSIQNVGAMRKRGKLTTVISGERYCLCLKRDVELNSPA